MRRTSEKRATTFGCKVIRRRRELVLLLGCAMMTARILRAQQKAMPVIGILGSTSPSPNAANVAAFRQGLSDIGYVEGRIWRSNTAGLRAITIDCPLWPRTLLAAGSM